MKSASERARARLYFGWQYYLQLLLFLQSPTGCYGDGLTFDSESKNPYNTQFFEQHKKHSPIYPVLAKILGRVVLYELEVFSVLDMGCGHGLLVEAWRNLGVAESYCIEGSDDAAPMWPPQHKDKYYQVLDLTQRDAAANKVPKTDVVTTFEVAEHLPEESALDFVRLLVEHKPAFVFFGAATVFQDKGLNPLHLNENTFSYWTKKFWQVNYVPDLYDTAKVKFGLFSNPTARVIKAWWYAKNAWVFVPAKRQARLDQKLVEFPADVDIGGPTFVDHANRTPLHEVWSCDWTKFATIFYREQSEAKKRLGVGC